MSEYQYYEFQAIDRRLSDKEMRELGSFSSRARITPTSCDDAIKLLTDLRDLDSHAEGSDFQMRVEELRHAHASKPSLIERLKKAGL